MSQSTQTIIIGGGLTGVATLHELTRRGERAVLLEAETGLAAVTSFANGGMLTASMSDPWNGPGVGRHLLASLFDPYAPMKLRPRAIPGLAWWGLKFLRHSTPARHAAATMSSFRLAERSVRRTKELTESLRLDYDASTVGTLKLFENRTALEGPKAISAMLGPMGLRFRVLSADEVVEMEPALAPARERIACALHYPGDAAGDACAFTRALADHARAAGAEIRTGAVVHRIIARAGRVCGVDTSAGVIPAGRVVVAAGCRSPALTAALGLPLPIKPAKGYSITVNVADLDGRPCMPVVDDAMHAAVTPLGQRLRVVGTAEFAGHDLSIDAQRIDNLFRLLDRIYPRLSERIDRRLAATWAGLRPMSADGLPFIGAAGPRGLWLNSGHGHLGWTMAVGSAELLADLMLGATPALDPHPYRVTR